MADAMPEPLFTCRLCHFPTPLDDVQILFASREQCICLRCYLAAVGRHATPGTPAPAPAPDPTPQPPSGAPPASAKDMTGDGPPLMRWWCGTCDDERWLPFVHFHRMACPVCDTPMRRFDEQFPPSNPFQ